VSADEQRELVELYTSGRMTRRQFVRRLIVGGVAVGSALAYAEALGSASFASAAARPASPHPTHPEHHEHHEHPEHEGHRGRGQQ
jgi:hypothetical protein